MSGIDTGPLLAIIALGAVHGVNPAMGWLFAVALGLQEKKGRAVWRALPPLALGHAFAVVVIAAAGMLAGRFIPHAALRWLVAAVLLAFGVHKLVRGHRHPRYGGMRVGSRDLTIWSFLMASAHGAGLMVLPFIIGIEAGTGHGDHAAHAGMMAGQNATLAAAALHTASYLLVTGVIAVVVYRKLGLRLLRTAWINLDVVWSLALIATALLTPLF